MSQNPEPEATGEPSTAPAVEELAPVSAEPAAEARGAGMDPAAEAASVGPPPVVFAEAVAPAPPSTYLGRRGVALLTRGTLMLAVISVCVVAFVVQMTGTFHAHDSANLRDFVNRNQLATRARAHLLLWLAAGAVAGKLAALSLYLWRRATRPPFARAAGVLRAARLLSPLALPALARPLLVATEWEALARASAIAAVTLLAQRCVQAAAAEVAAERVALARLLARLFRWPSSTAAGRRRVVYIETGVVLLGVAFYAVWMSWATILQHREFATFAYDLGNYDNMFYNLMHGRPFRTLSVLPTGGTWSMLSNHAELTMFVLMPFYALRPGSETLLIMQATSLALGAIPLYRFAARRLPRPAAMLLALAYLAYAPMHEANFYDIHFQPFAVPLVLLALDALDAEKPLVFGISFVLAMGCREDVPIGFIVLGVYLLLVGKRTRMALAMTVLAACYFVVIKVVVMPRFGAWWFNEFYKELYPAGENTYGGIVKTLLSNPTYVFKTLVNTEKIVLLLLVLTPLAFLPLRRGLLWMSLLPAIPFTILTTAYWPTVQISFQYILFFVPFLFTASALVLAHLRNSPRGVPRLWGALGAIAFATFLTTRVWGALPPGPGDKFKGGFRDIPSFRPVTALEKQKERDIAELIAKIPKKASISVSEVEHPHVSNRMDVMTLRVSYAGADYILYAEDSGGFGADIARKALASGEYEIVERRPVTGMVLLRKKQK
ncbi:MAG TPA: DUF2079 domain-containing protein [Polyangia bacterium]|nr:DUF2079 domain-containing protein [Polyangia bacterium]